MFKRPIAGVIIASAILIVAALLMRRQQSGPVTGAVPDDGKGARQKITGGDTVELGHPLANNTPADRILSLAEANRNPAAMAALLRQLFAENPDGLFATLLAFDKTSLETRRTVLPLLADALVLWPEAEGRYVFPVADAYAEVDLPAAAEWGASFLVKTGRSDLAASSLLGRLSEVSEARALSLIATLPTDAKRDAMNYVAYHIGIEDLNHLIQVCGSLDPQGISTFSKQLFERLGAERLEETAAWMQKTPAAAQIPGAVAAISQALVINGGPQKAIVWADSLPEVNAEAQAITMIYREWAKESPENAIKDILANYDGAPQLMADVFNGAAERHGNSAGAQWDAACGLVNPSARAYAISALIEPMLVAMGPNETQSRIVSLMPGSLERNAAELMVKAAFSKPATVQQIETRFGKSQ